MRHSPSMQDQDNGSMWAQMSERAASPGSPWRMGGLGFGLPLSRLYARYFGKLRSIRAPLEISSCADCADEWPCGKAAIFLHHLQHNWPTLSGAVDIMWLSATQALTRMQLMSGNFKFAVHLCRRRPSSSVNAWLWSGCLLEHPVLGGTVGGDQSGAAC